MGCCSFWGGGSVVVALLFGVLPIGCGGSVFVFVLLCTTLRPFQFCNHLEEEERVPEKYFTDRSKAVLLLWIFYVFVLSCVCYVFVRVCLYVLGDQLLEKG